ncbi:MAG: hypothetical protein SH859_16625 [Hyphomicrobium aestuarii]|nr:hypothetical protein [Hyphomicrobium aestuarii]
MARSYRLRRSTTAATAARLAGATAAGLTTGLDAAARFGLGVTGLATCFAVLLRAAGPEVLAVCGRLLVVPLVVAASRSGVANPPADDPGVPPAVAIAFATAAFVTAAIAFDGAGAVSGTRAITTNGGTGGIAETVVLTGVANEDADDGGAFVAAFKAGIATCAGAATWAGALAGIGVGSNFGTKAGV